MKERPITFSAEMVRAILKGRKSQTRRVIAFPRSTGAFVCVQGFWKDRPDEWQPLVSIDGESTDDGKGCETPILCPYGVPGDRLWVKETFYSWRCKIYSSSGITEEPEECVYRANGGTLVNGAQWKSSRFMRREYSRITLEITNVRVERLQDISEEDAKAEGVVPYSMTQQDIDDLQISDSSPDEKLLARLMGPGSFSHKFTFQMLWDELNEKRGYGWNVNPWVWRIAFKRVAE